MLLSKKQISYIRERIEQEGIDNTELRNDIIDHICCSIEAKLGTSEDFENIFNQVFADFCPEQGLNKLGVEIKYISNYKWMFMKKSH